MEIDVGLVLASQYILGFIITFGIGIAFLSRYKSRFSRFIEVFFISLLWPLVFFTGGLMELNSFIKGFTELDNLEVIDLEVIDDAKNKSLPD